ncbi:tetratricopeptide repeat protein [Pleurocapsa sp. FMAR1]|uniref:tetratricopeptide repeat protein n=1 Tax=Pleurocapsa sp. FMAR1 TaxID=3040204 RepID=UPI0029C809E2|nr:tetratricopeptide repeat protein [Pleurocapsa sp. FMAR1]
MIQIDEAQVCLNQAQIYWQKQEWQLTIQACAKALALNQKLTDAYKLMGDALQKTGKIKEALGYYLQAISIEPNFAEVYANLGFLYAKQEQWSQAIVHYQKAIHVKPELVGVYRQLAKVYQKLQQPEKAQVYLTQADEIEKRSTKVLSSSLERQQSSTSVINSVQSLDEYLRQGQLLKQQGEFQPALEQYFQAAKLEPRRVNTYREIVVLCEQLELWSEAAKYCQVILKLTNSASLNASQTNPQAVTPVQTNRQSSKFFAQEAEQYYSLGTLHTKKEEWSAAVESYQKAIALNPKMAKAYRDLARAQTQLGDKKQSAEHLLKAISLDNENVSAAEYLELGKNLVSWGNQQSALTCYRRAIARQPELIAAYLGLGELLVQMGAIKKAIACYVEALKHGQDDPQLYYRLGSLYRLQSQWSQATLCYQRATQYDAKNSAAFHQLGEVLTHQELWSEAIVAYRQAIELNSDFFWSYNNLGYALIQLEQWSEAITIYQQAIKLNPQFPWSYYNLAEAYGKLDRWDRAVDFYQQAAKIQPDLPKIQLKLGDALFRRSQQDREVALKHFQLAIEQNPDDPEVYHHALAIDKTNLKFYLKLGDILVRSGEIDQAIVTYQMALQIQPKNGAAMARLQEILLKRPNCNVGQYISNVSTAVVEYSQSDLKSLGAELQQILPHSNEPQVSIIIPVYNQLNYTLDCLKAIATNVHKSTAIEIILVNDCSTDETKKILEPISAINLVNNQSNQGFIYSCNQGASLAKGKYLYFLNNDTQIKPNCIESLIEVLDQDHQVGAVGSKLIYAQGALQEAGGIIWQDASGWNYGRQDNANAPEYNYLRPVDYCSAASLMVRTEIFERLQGFEQDFAPAYYEDTDLCFAIRHQLGLKVMYQPKSEVIHYEGISSGTSTSSGTKKYQLVNGVKFRQKWQDVLNGQYLPNTGVANVPLASRKYLGNKTILIIDSYMPCYDKESGSRRLFELLKIFKSLNFHVIFAADNGYKAEPYTSVMENLQIEVLYTQQGYGNTIDQQINERLSLIDAAWICRPELNEKYTSLIKSKQSIKVIYDTIDLHYLRLKRAWELSAKQSPESAKDWQRMQATELRLASQADLTITVTAIEQEILQAQLEPKTISTDKVAVVPNIHFPYQGDIPSFHERSGILFIGSYNHPPNVDAILWLCQKIMPLVWQKQPDIKVTLLGSNVTPEVKALAGDKITVTGYVDDVSSYFLSHKLSVSPLRYGAGMKGKIGQSLEYSLPVVSTEIGTEGMNLQPEQILEANNTEDFAEQILRLYNDVNLWNSLSFNSWQAIAPYTPETIKQNIKELMQGLIE